MVNTVNLVNRTPKRNPHVVARVVFSQGLVECKCGEVIRATGHDAIREAFTAHRAAYGISPGKLGAGANRSTDTTWKRTGHCRRGHPLIEDNLVKNGRGRRDCKTCHRQRQREHVARRAA